MAFEYGSAARMANIFHKRWTTMITSRSCPFNCNFCSIHLSIGRRYRCRSPENVMLEIDELVNRFGIRHINIEDDNFTLNEVRVHKICDSIIARNYQISFSLTNGIRADKITEPMVARMAQAGLRYVFVAPESGSQRVVSEIIKKDLDLAKVEAAFIIGFIGETKREIWETIRFASRLKKCGLAKAGFQIATPLYGTRLYEEALEKGYLAKEFNDDLLTTDNPLIETPLLKGADLIRFQRMANWLVNQGLREKIQAIFKHLDQISGNINLVLRGWLFPDGQKENLSIQTNRRRV